MIRPPQKDGIGEMAEVVGTNARLTCGRQIAGIVRQDLIELFEGSGKVTGIHGLLGRGKGAA